MVRHIVLKVLRAFGRRGQAGRLEHPLRRADVVRDDVLKQKVDAAIVRDLLVVPDVGAEHPLDAVDPIGDMRLDIRLLLVRKHGKPAHRQHRLQYRERIAMRLHDEGVRVVAHQRGQLLAVLIALQDPAPVVRKLKGDRLQHRAAVGVMRRLIVREIIVAPARHIAHPFPLIGREIGHLQFVFTAGMVRRMLMQGFHDRVRCASAPNARSSAASAGPCRPAPASRPASALLPIPDRPANSAAGGRRRSGSQDGSCRSGAARR